MQIIQLEGKRDEVVIRANSERGVVSSSQLQLPLIQHVPPLGTTFVPLVQVTCQ